MVLLKYTRFGEFIPPNVWCLITLKKKKMEKGNPYPLTEKPIAKVASSYFFSWRTLKL